MQHALPELPCFYLQRRSHGLQLWSLTLVTILFEMCGGIHLEASGAIVTAGKENYFQCLCSSTAAGTMLDFTNVSLSYSGL